MTKKNPKNAGRKKLNYKSVPIRISVHPDLYNELKPVINRYIKIKMLKFNLIANKLK